MEMVADRKIGTRGSLGALGTMNVGGNESSTQHSAHGSQRSENGTRDPGPGSRRHQALVVGLGASGMSALGYLQRQGCVVRATDDRADKAPLAGEAWCPPETAGECLDDVDTLVVSPGVPLNSPLIKAARERGIEVLGDIELFARALDRVPGSGSRVPEVIAVTGTNGKSTVASLVAAMAARAGRRVAAGANLGTPALDLIAPDVEVYVLELSSFQLETTISLVPAAAVVLNVSADHLDRYPGLEVYAAAKARIYARAGIAVANRDDPVVMEMVQEMGGVVSFGLGVPAAGEYGLCKRGGETFLCRGDETLLAAREVPLAGRHNRANVLASWALGAALGLPDEAIREAVRAFRPLPHRLAPVGSHRGVRYLDDSKATNVSAACAALAGLAGPLVVIAGGEGKGQDFAAFADCLAARAHAVVLIGVAANAIEAAIAGRVLVVRANSMDAAVEAAAVRSEPGGCVVLAPACASFDMFRDYKARGELFVRAVEALNGD
ncbi:MAG: UDP-N-acetylmuramoyl-L-alanine--D-glutamate ligase [Acetobacteraceae bacterium]